MSRHLITQPSVGQLRWESAAEWVSDVENMSARAL